jgi:hypothetical protein
MIELKMDARGRTEIGTDECSVRVGERERLALQSKVSTLRCWPDSVLSGELHLLQLWMSRIRAHSDYTKYG